MDCHKVELNLVIAFFCDNARHKILLCTFVLCNFNCGSLDLLNVHDVILQFSNKEISNYHLVLQSVIVSLHFHLIDDAFISAMVFHMEYCYCDALVR